MHLHVCVRVCWREGGVTAKLGGGPSQSAASRTNQEPADATSDDFFFSPYRPPQFSVFQRGGSACSTGAAAAAGTGGGGGEAEGRGECEASLRAQLWNLTQQMSGALKMCVW